MDHGFCFIFSDMISSTMQKFQQTHLRHMGREYVFCLKTSWDFPLISGDILEQFLTHHRLLSSEEEVSTAQAPSFREETGIAGGGIISLITSSSPTNVIFTVCFWTPLNPLRLFEIPFFKTDCFSPSFYELWTDTLWSKLATLPDPVVAPSSFLWLCIQASKITFRIWNELRDFWEHGNVEQSVPFTFKPRKFGCFEQVTVAAKKNLQNNVVYFTLQKNLCKNKQHIQNLDRFK